MLVGELPKPANFGTKCPKVYVCGPSLSLLCLMAAPLGGAVKVVEIALGGG